MRRALEQSRYSGLDEILHLHRDDRDPAGELAFVSRTLRRWLADRPESSGQDRSDAEATAAMACSWSTSLTHALAEGPCTVEELRDAVTPIYDAEILDEHLRALVETGQAETLRGDRRRYLLTEWGVEALAPLIAAAHYEARFPAEDVLAPETIDAEAAFQLTAPLLDLPPHLRGTCHLKVHLPDDDSAQPPAKDRIVAGAAVDVAGGRIVSSSILLELEPQTWAFGTPLDWCEAVVDPAAARLDMGGDTELGGALLTALHERLFGDPDPVH